MDAQTCGDIKSALMSLPIYIFTDEDVKQEAGGAWVLYDNGNTEIYLSEDIWSLSGAQFEDELYKKLSHEGAHEVAFQDNGGLENWGSMDYHGEAWSTKFQTCYSN